MRKIGLLIVMICCMFGGYLHANSDIYIESITLNNTYIDNGEVGIFQGSTPRINIAIGNNGPDVIEYDDVGSGFILCTSAGQTVFQSSYIGSIYIEPGGFWIRNNLQLNPILTQALTPKTVQCQVNPNQAAIIDPNANNNQQSITFGVFVPPTGRFDLTLDRSIETIQQNLDPAEAALGTQGVVNFIRRNIINFLIPIVIIVGVVVAIVGFYRMMFSDSEEGTQKGSKYLIWGVVGIIVMMSARYITNNVLFDNIFIGGNIQEFNGIQAAQALYSQAIFPFIKIVMYLVMGILFIIIAIRVLQYLTNPSEDVKKQAATLIARNVIGIFIILGSKQIVELIFGSEEEIMQQSAQDIGDIGSGILSGNLPILYTIINWIMGLAAFVILVIIILQTYQLLVNPTNEETMTKIKRSFLYIAIGILVIGAGYVITNFLIIN